MFMIRGDGLQEPQGAIHEQGFRSFTIKKLEKLHKKNINFMVERGQHGQFMKTWVFISHSKAVFNVEAMDAYLKLTFLSTGDDARLHYPREDGLLSLGLFKQMSSDFVVLGRKVGGVLFDLSRTG